MNPLMYAIAVLLFMVVAPIVLLLSLPVVLFLYLTRRKDDDPFFIAGRP